MELDELSQQEFESLEVLFGALDEIRELPCSICGDTSGDTFPCIRCDKLLCGKCGEGIRWCKEYVPTEEEVSNWKVPEDESNYQQ